VKSESPKRSRTTSGGVWDPNDLIRALCHDVGNLLAAVRLSAHLLSIEIPEEDRLSISRDIEGLVAQAGALLAHVRPLQSGANVSRVPVSLREVLSALSGALKDRRMGSVALSIANGRNLPDVRVDPDALFHLLLTLVRGSLEAAVPDGKVRVTAEHRGRRVILSVIDDGRQLDLDEIRHGSAPRGRELAVRVADAVLRPMGGRAAAELRRRGSRVDLFLPAMAQKKKG
jgi:nitrogen-specific signal transduction histidine kinase